MIEEPRVIPQSLGRTKEWFPSCWRNGIIWTVTRKQGGNVHDKGIVRITSKSAQVEPRHVADFDSLQFFSSDNQPGQWICCDFGEMRVHPTQYVIQTQIL
jgi:hypothetical protein